MKSLTLERVEVLLASQDAPGRPTGRTVCVRCAEEINDRREVKTADGPLCRSCALGTYYLRTAMGDTERVSREVGQWIGLLPCHGVIDGRG